jgi:methyl halide transferase
MEHKEILTMDAQYWQKRYEDGETGWDIGRCSKPLQQLIDNLEDTSAHILIPGCGNAHEAYYAYKKGFKHVFIADWAEAPIQNFKKQYPDFPASNILQVDFFKLKQSFDIIIEQTFFCAINPALRTEYVQQTLHLLNENGKLIGVLFNDTLNNDKPPFGGNIEEYQRLFSHIYSSVDIKPCTHSESARAGREVWIEAKK